MRPYGKNQMAANAAIWFYLRFTMKFTTGNSCPFRR